MSRQVDLGQIVPNIQVGTTTTGLPSTPASVENVGTDLNPIFNFTIPKGNTGATPNIQIGDVQTGDTSEVTRTGTDENPIFNFTLEKGDTGNGIASITKTSTSGLVDTYTITFTNGQTTTYQITNGANGSVVDVQVDGTSVVDNGIANIIGLTEMKQELEDMYNLLPKVQGTGEIITLDGTVAGKMLVDLKGNTSQETTTGKNLLNLTNLTAQTSNGITITPTFENGKLLYITTSGTYSQTTYFTLNNNQTVAPNTQYILTGGYSPSARLRIREYDSNDTNLSEYWDTGSGVSFTSKSNVEHINVQIVFYAQNNNAIFYPMVRLSSITDATYEPYTNGASPNPDYPQDIHVVSGDNSIDVCGKNTIPNDTTGSISWVGTGVKYTGQEIRITKSGNNGISANPYTNAIYFPLKAGETYTFSTRYRSGTIVLGGRYRWIFYVYGVNEDGTTAQTSGNRWELTIDKSTTTPSIASVTFTPSKNFVGYKLGCYIPGDSPTTDGDVYFDCQLEVNNQATTYEAYKSASYPITLPEGMFLGWIPNTDYRDIIFQAKTGDTYYDSLDSTTKESLTYGKWYLNKQIGKVVLNGSESGWSYPSANRFNLDDFSNGYFKNTGSLTYLSNYYEAFKQTQDNGAFNTLTANTNYGFNLSSTPSNYYTARFKNKNITSIDDFKIWLSTHNTTVYYVLATPTYTEITDTTLISQLEAVKRSYNEQTNISQENNDLPFILDVTALKELTQ